MSNRKTLAASGIAALTVATVVGGGTFAAFVDTETVKDNSIAAGTLDLVLSGGSATAPVTVEDIKPGDTGSQTITLKNPGTIGTGPVSVSFVEVTNAENTCLEPETEAGDASCTNAQNDAVGAGLGELQNNLQVTITNGTTEIYKGKLADVPTGVLATKVASLGAASVPADQDVTVAWSFESIDDKTDSKAMTDSVSFKLQFDTAQGV